MSHLDGRASHEANGLSVSSGSAVSDSRSASPSVASGTGCAGPGARTGAFGSVDASGSV